MSVLYTAEVTAVGAREGHVKSSDGLLDLDLAVPKEMGGRGSAATNPEQMFAAGYAACFGGAAEYLAQQQKLKTGAITVKARVGIGPNDAGPGFALTVALDVTIAELDQAAAEKLVAEAHVVCPYSNATRNNIDVKLTAHGGK